MSDHDPGLAAFMLARDNIQEAIKGLDGQDACLALTMALAECIVLGNSEHDEPDEMVRLAQTIQVLGAVVVFILTSDDDHDGSDDDKRSPAPPSTDLLRKLLEHRRAAKGKS